ncbi:MAG: response regulator transcription factor [Thermodesulfobacteriota bacterium]
MSRILIVEDEETGKHLLESFMSPYGQVDSVENGEAAVAAFDSAWKEADPYQLVLLDIMIPKMDGQEVLRWIRNYEREQGILSGQRAKIVMTTALDDPSNIMESFYSGGADSYVVKPIELEKLQQELQNLGF